MITGVEMGFENPNPMACVMIDFVFLLLVSNQSNTSLGIEYNSHSVLESYYSNTAVPYQWCDSHAECYKYPELYIAQYHVDRVDTPCELERISNW